MGEAATRWLVSGRVQGVGFRWFAARRAQELALRGWVKNLPDGQVEVVGVGEQTSLDEMGRFLARGPRAALVARVEKLEIPLETIECKSFDIK